MRRLILAMPCLTAALAVCRHHHPPCLSKATSPRLLSTSLKARASSAEILKRDQEKKLFAEGLRYVIGVDEAGRGPLAGPVVAASLCCLPSHVNLIRAADSKVLSEKQREALYAQIQADESLVFAFAAVDEQTIDQINILQATMLAMAQSVDALLAKAPEITGRLAECYALVDGNKAPKLGGIKSRPVVRGDALVYPIALASIVAKVERDRMMVALDKEYPQYGFARHKGYPSKEHILNLHKYGPCPVHRRSFKPVKGRDVTPQKAVEGREAGPPNEVKDGGRR